MRSFLKESDSIGPSISDPVEPDQKNLQSKDPVELDQWSLWNLEGEQNLWSFE